MAQLLLLFLVATVSCRTEPDDEVAAWRAVLATKKAIDRVEAAEKNAARQAYADRLRQFLRQYPHHTRAREVYLQIELDHARALLARGDYDGAGLFYASVLRDEPGNELARQEWSEAMKRRFLTREALENLHKGMRQREVAERIGTAPEQWTRTIRKGDTILVSWYYPRSDGGVGGVYFMNGRLFAAEFDRPVRLKD